MSNYTFLFSFEKEAKKRVKLQGKKQNGGKKGSVLVIFMMLHLTVFFFFLSVFEPIAHCKDENRLCSQRKPFPVCLQVAYCSAVETSLDLSISISLLV